MPRLWKRAPLGFTLVEVLASITVFSVMILGIAPLIATSLRGAALSRSFTVGKSLAQQYMERIRGLPYYDAAPKRDISDLYFPDLGTGYSTTPACTEPRARTPEGTLVPCGPRFTTVCTATTATPSPSATLACPPKNADGTSRIPPGYQVTYSAQYVNARLNSNPEVYDPYAPTAGYSAASPAAASQLMNMMVTVEWTQSGRKRAFQLVTLLGDRRGSPDKIRSRASIDFMVQAITSYVDNLGCSSNLRAIGGRSVSTGSLRNFATADQDTSATSLVLAGRECAGLPGAAPVQRTGAEAFLHAPPDVAPTTAITGATTEMDAPTGVTIAPSNKIAGFTTSTANEPLNAFVFRAPGVAVANQLPRAAGNLGLNQGNGDEFWVTNQADTTSASALRLAPGAHVLSVQRPSGTSADKRLGGNTYVESTALAPASTRRVESRVFVQIPQIYLLPTTYAPQGVVKITDFKADITCRSTGVASGAVATGTWTANFYYSKGNLTGTPQYSSPPGGAGIGGSTTPGAWSDRLQDIKGGNNPVIVNDPLQKIYLFDEPAAGKKGYLSTMDSTPTISSVIEGATSRVSMPSAINITTAPTDPANAESGLAISIGRVSCEAVDNRV